jgi:hypothetical protein
LLALLGAHHILHVSRIRVKRQVINLRSCCIPSVTSGVAASLRLFQELLHLFGYFRSCCISSVTSGVAASLWLLQELLHPFGYFRSCCISLVTSGVVASLRLLQELLHLFGYFRSCCISFVTSDSSAFVFTLGQSALMFRVENREAECEQESEHLLTGIRQATTIKTARFGTKCDGRFYSGRSRQLFYYSNLNTSRFIDSPNGCITLKGRLKAVGCYEI